MLYHYTLFICVVISLVQGWKKERICQNNPDGSRVVVVISEDKFATKKVILFGINVPEIILLKQKRHYLDFHNYGPWVAL